MIKTERKLFLLLVCLVIILFIYPLIGKFDESTKLMALFYTAVLISAVYALSGNNRRTIALSIALAAPAVILIWADEFYPNKAWGNHLLDVLANISLFLFTFFAAGCVLAYIMRAKKVTSDILAGAACTYLLFGISWGMVYSLLDLVAPGSFLVEGAVREASAGTWSLFNYYSFVTLTTLGYGDITPLTERAQSLAILESVTGVLFVALLISRLVGVYISQNIRKEEGKG